jgi:NAD(P)-dependent dehydrogenase (short-subunit alcohol dehydrogenase family)
MNRIVFFQVAKKPQLRNVGYSLSKASLSMLTRIMAYELGKHQIRVNAISPGAVLTQLLIDGCDVMFKCPPGEGVKILEKTLLKRKRMPTGQVYVGVDDIVNTTLFLLTDLSPMMIGENILIDGGQHLT